MKPIFMPEMPRIADGDLPIEFSIGAVAFRISRGRMYQAQIITPAFQVAIAGATPTLAFGNLLMYLGCCAGSDQIEGLVEGISAEARPPGEEMEFPEDWDDWMLEMFGEDAP